MSLVNMSIPAFKALTGVTSIEVLDLGNGKFGSTDRGASIRVERAINFQNPMEMLVNVDNNGECIPSISEGQSRPSFNASLINKREREVLATL